MLTQELIKQVVQNIIHSGGAAAGSYYHHRHERKYHDSPFFHFSDTLLEQM